MFVYGGSNSLLKDGWVSRFAARRPDLPINNRSIGAATSLMALFRLLTDEDVGPKPGDTILWEYALNEGQHVKNGYDIDLVLLNAERFIREAARRELKIAAAIFTSRPLEISGSRGAYYDRIFKLLAHYNVVHFDVNQAWRASTGRPLGPDFYRDDVHYGPDAKLMNFIAEGVSSVIDKAQVSPLRDALLVSGASVRVQLCEGGEVFRNSLISVPVAPSRSSMRFDFTGRLIGVANLLHPESESALRIELTSSGHEGRWLNLSATKKFKNEQYLLKVSSIEAATGSAWVLNPGDELRVYPLSESQPLYSEINVRGKVPKLDPKPPASFVGVVYELPS